VTQPFSTIFLIDWVPGLKRIGQRAIGKTSAKVILAILFLLQAALIYSANNSNVADFYVSDFPFPLKAGSSEESFVLTQDSEKLFH